MNEISVAVLLLYYCTAYCRADKWGRVPGLPDRVPPMPALAFVYTLQPTGYIESEIERALGKALLPERSLCRLVFGVGM